MLGMKASLIKSHLRADSYPRLTFKFWVLRQMNRVLLPLGHWAGAEHLKSLKWQVLTVSSLALTVDIHLTANALPKQGLCAEEQFASLVCSCWTIPCCFVSLEQKGDQKSSWIHVCQHQPFRTLRRHREKTTHFLFLDSGSHHSTWKAQGLSYLAT